MLEQVMTLEETKTFSCSVLMFRMTLVCNLKRYSSVSFDIVLHKNIQAYSYVD